MDGCIIPGVECGARAMSLRWAIYVLVGTLLGLWDRRTPMWMVLIILLILLAFGGGGWGFGGGPYYYGGGGILVLILILILLFGFR
jgi:hypothetical protein